MRSHIRLILIFLLFLSARVWAVDYYFYIQFTDKNDSPYSISQPNEFLSERALQRRAYFGMDCDSTDLPVNPHYIEEIHNSGVKICNTSKWLNGITILTQDSSVVEDLKQFQFVDSIQFTGKRNNGLKNKKKSTVSLRSQLSSQGIYGYADDQIEQINGKYLHESGYKGEGIHIAVLDAGFNNANINPAFNRLFLENRLLGTKDFVEEESDIYELHSHGANVLSTMATDVNTSYIGTAPDASYWLIRTEETSFEYLVETDFWIAGIEFADSAGVDIVNSSLGYTTFDDSNMNFTHEDLDGNTTRISKAAELAAKKGIIVVSSAGNEGNKNWKKICAPADAKGIITVGGVNDSGVPSSFSSFGPSSDLRIKPEIVARATSTAIMNKDGVATSNGTSFSSPIVAGMMACLLQAVKENHSSFDLGVLLQSVFESASLYDNPEDQLGYGIPDFEKSARKLLNDELTNLYSPDESISIYINGSNKTLYINTDEYSSLLQIYSIDGELVFNQSFNYKINVDIGHYPKGLYAVRVLQSNKETQTQKILIH